MAWDAYAWFLLVGGIVGTTVGLLVLVLGPTRPANQLLATILIAQGLFPQGVLRAIQQAEVAPGWFVAATDTGTGLAIMALGFLHLLFIGQAIPHRSVAWLRTPAGAAAVVGAWLATMATMLLPGLLAFQMVIALGVALAAAIYSAVAAWLAMMSHAPGTASRRRATLYFVAFVARDIGLAWMTLATAVQGTLGLGIGWFVAGRCIMLVSHLLIATALLRAQVLGLNRKIAAGTSGAVAAVLLALVFIAATELLEEAVSRGDRLVDIFAAVALTMLFWPLQSAAERALVRIFPSARPLATWADAERAAAYREQVELAWADGRLGNKERRMLERMAAALSLPPKTAADIEAEAVRPQRAAARRATGAGA